MTTFPNSPKLIKGGIVLPDPETAQVKDVISLQYNPESMSSSFQIQQADALFRKRTVTKIRTTVTQTRELAIYYSVPKTLTV